MPLVRVNYLWVSIAAVGGQSVRFGAFMVGIKSFVSKQNSVNMIGHPKASEKRNQGARIAPGTRCAEMGTRQTESPRT